MTIGFASGNNIAVESLNCSLDVGGVNVSI